MGPIASVPATGGQRSTGRHDQFSYCLLSLLTYLQPISSQSFYCRGSRTVSYSAAICVTCILPHGLPCTEAPPVPAQEPVLSTTLSLSNSLTRPNTVHALPRSPAVSYAPSLLRSGNAPAKESSGGAFNSTTLFDWITLTGAVLPPHAEPQITRVQAHQINLSSPSRSNLFHHLRSAQPMEVEGTTTRCACLLDRFPWIWPAVLSVAN